MNGVLLMRGWRAWVCLLALATMFACGSSDDDTPPTGDEDVLGDASEEVDAPDIEPDAEDVADTTDADADVAPDADVQEEVDPGDIADEDADPDPSDDPWTLVLSGADEALLSVQGTRSDDVWVVGADHGRGPLVLHWDGEEWERHETGLSGHLWWVFPLEDGPVYVGGSEGQIARFDGTTWERMQTPGLGRHTVYGIWGAAPDDVYAVGSVSGHSGFVWHFDGDQWREVPVPADIPKLAHGGIAGLFKVWGDGAGTVWIVGAQGALLRRDGTGPLERIDAGITDTLFTVFGSEDGVFAVGGASGGEILRVDADVSPARETPDDAPLFQGVCVGESGAAWAGGAFGSLYTREGEEWVQVFPDVDIQVESWHAVWVDERDGIWAVGGGVLSPALDEGAILHRGPGMEPVALDPIEPPVPAEGCPEGEVEAWLDRSMARQWNEQVLAAIRRDIPMPGVHARNLFHLSAVLWDAWATFEPGAERVFGDEFIEVEVGERRAAQEEAMSHAAYRLLSHRYANSRGRLVTQGCLDQIMALHGFDPSFTDEVGDAPAAVGNRIGAEMIAFGLLDGAREEQGYLDPTDYVSPNPVLFVDEPGIEIVDPDAWQYLDISVAETQNGIPLLETRQPYIGPHWGGVVPFALERPDPDASYFDVGPGPRFSDPEMVDWVVEVIRLDAQLDVESGRTIDISPGAYGNNPLGSNEGIGHPVNPFTGEPYEPQIVAEGDFGRVLAEYWADGPDSETPPGHWNVLVNRLADNPLFSRRIQGQGEELEPLHWDLAMYLALNGAVHDAAIVAWEVKRDFVTSRPITLIRYMGQLGQSSDPQLPSYHPDGLPLVDGLIELVTEESSQPGERHELLRPYVGEVVLWNWPGEPGDRASERTPFRWIRAVEWMPYQRRTFVTPAFPGYVSGHSTFSRSAATVITELTGSPYFPGGLGEFVARHHDYLHFESGPEQEVRLQWATYFDAADQAGQSRIWGGIHITPDDFMGRTLGAEVGDRAFTRAMDFIGVLVP